jgi:hypothetical protein
MRCRRGGVGLPASSGCGVVGAVVAVEVGEADAAIIDALKQRIVHLEQTVVDLRLQLDERGNVLAAARAANRKLMLRTNQGR